MQAVSESPLTARAIESCACASRNRNDSPTSTRACLASMIVDQVPRGIPTSHPIRRDEVSNAGATIADSLGQDTLNLPVDLPSPEFRKTVDRAVGVDSRPEQNLIRINVPDPSYKLLVHEERLDPSSPIPDHRPERLPIHREGIQSEPACGIGRKPSLVHQPHPPESARIPVS